MQTSIYLDYAATTSVDPRVAAVMGRYLTMDGCFGNPASDHDFGRAAARAVDQARTQVAALINGDPEEIVWTSGATESNNLALKGAAQAYRKQGRHIVTCKTEHRAVLDTCRRLESDGCQVTYLDPEPSGLIDPDKLAQAMRDDTLLVSLMHVNNETGVAQDLEAIGEITHQRGVLFHVDAAQSAGKLPIDLKTLKVDLMSFSGHKIYGPKGIGALFVRRWPRVRLESQIHGGGQEWGLRAGTLPTHQIAGMGEAFRIAQLEITDDHERIRTLRQRLWDGIRDLDAVHLHGDPEQRVAGIMNVSFPFVESEALLAALKDIAVSSGSACASASREPSHVLRAMGCGDQLAQSAIRFSIGRFTTTREIDYAIEIVRKGVMRLRELSPLWELR